MRPSLKRSALMAVLLAAIAGAVGSLLLKETPHGAVRGLLITAESGRALSSTNVVLTAAGGKERYRTKTDGDGRFLFPNVATGAYRLVARTQAHQQDPTPLVVEEGQTVDAVYELKPVAPFLEVFGYLKVFTTRENARIRVHGFAPVRELSIRLWRVRPEAALDAWHGSLREALRLKAEPSPETLAASSLLEPPKTMTYPIHGRDVEGMFREEVPLGKLAPGVYVAAFDALKARAVETFTVTDLGILVKAGQGKALVYAGDIDTGEPAPGTRVEVRRDEKTILTGATGPDGLLAVSLPAAGEGERVLDVVGRRGPSVSVARIYQYRDETDRPLRVYSYTDRPVYRPGQTVYFKSMMRLLRDGQYAVPKGERVTVRVVDRNDDLIYAANLTANAYGSLDGSFTLNEEALPGGYQMTVRPARGGLYESSFSVAEYRKPEYSVKVTTPKDRYTRGESIPAVIDAQYYYGAPVGGATVEWSVTRNQKWYWDTAGDWDEDLEEDTNALEGVEGVDESERYGETIADGRGRTDASGRLQITIPPPEDEANTVQDEDTDWVYTVHATVTDVSRRAQEGSGSVLVTQGDFRLSVEPDQYLARPNQAVAVQVRAEDYDGKPVPNASGTVELVRVTWEKGEERIEERTAQPFQADTQGIASVSVTPRRDGDYRIRAIARDARGNTIRQSGYLWVMSDGYADFAYPYQELQVRAGKRLYHEGETAEIVVHTKYAPQTALLTLEGDDVLDQRLVRLPGKTTILKVPVTARLMPAARASVSLIHKKRLVSGEAVLNVSRERRALQVEVTPDKPKYEPGQTAVYRVRTLSPEGRPVPAEVSLGIVDEAVYAIMPDTTPNIVAYFYPRRLYGVETSFSFPTVYLSGDVKGGSTIRTRRFFPDTAFWRASAVTDRNGQATFRITWPDNLTTWRATCRAATMDTRVGQTTAQAVVQKPFLVRLEAPRFFAQGDEVEVAGVVHNLTGAPVDATVALEPGSLRLAGSVRQQRRVGAGRTERFAWRVRADAVGDTPVRVWARAGSYSDAMELTLPVLPKGRMQTAAKTGGLARAETLTFEVRQDAIPDTARLTVRLAPSVLGTMIGALDYLAGYPYGCTEQTLSAFLPDIVLYDMLRRENLSAPGLAQKLPDMVRAGLLRLYGYQHEDGGWRWWRYDDTDPWMTAYVVYGLTLARNSGFEVNPSVYSRGLAALARTAGNPDAADADTRAFAAYVLSLAGRQDAARSLVSGFSGYQGAARRSHLSDWGRAYLALAVARTGNLAGGRAILQHVFAHFQDGTYTPYKVEEHWRSDAEYGAALLFAACELTPNDERLPDLARWIMDQRRGDHWCSTRDTAAVLYALSRYVALTGELRPDMTATVTVNGRPVASRRFTPADVAQPEVVLTVPASQLPKGPVEVGLSKAGTGRLYYTAELTQSAAEDLSLPVRNASGLVVERAYRMVEPPRKGRKPGGKPEPERPPQTEFATGDVIEVTLTVRAQQPFEYVMVEDPLPAGCEAEDRGVVDPWEWDNWWADQIPRDEKVAFAVRSLEAGVRRIRYRVRAQTPGRFTALPPRIYDMYNPDAQGEGAAQVVTVR